MLVDQDVLKNLIVWEINETFVALECSIQNQEFLIVNVQLRSDDFIEDLEKLSAFIREILDSFHDTLLIGRDFNARIGTLN